MEIVVDRILELEMTHDFGLYTFLVFAVLFAVWCVWSSIADGIRRNKKEALGQRMIAKANWYGARLVRNIDHDVMAVCSKATFEDGLSVHHEKVENGQIKPWEQVVCYANPTFTFAGSKQTFRPIHTGLRCDMEDWIALKLEEMTGIRRDQVSRKDFDAAVEQIMPRDTRLFVPYSGSASEKQFAMFGAQTLGDFTFMVHQAFK